MCLCDGAAVPETKPRLPRFPFHLLYSLQRINEWQSSSRIAFGFQRPITNAQERLYLVSPYLQINQLLKERIEDKVHRSKIEIRVIYREINPKQMEEKKWLESMTSIKTSIAQESSREVLLE